MIVVAGEWDFCYIGTVDNYVCSYDFPIFYLCIYVFPCLKAVQSDILGKTSEFEELQSQFQDIADHVSCDACAAFEDRTEALLKKYELLREDAVKAVEVTETDVESFLDECQKVTEWLADVKKFVQPKTESASSLMLLSEELAKCNVRDD